MYVAVGVDSAQYLLSERGNVGVVIYTASVVAQESVEAPTGW